MFTLLKKTFWLISDYIWIFARFFSVKRKEKSCNNLFTIGMVTYIDRYEKFFLKIIDKLVWLFPDVEIIIIINGYYDCEKQLIYLKKIKEVLDEYHNVKYIDHIEPQGLSNLWNKIIVNASNNKIFIFNDDININILFRINLYQSNILRENIALINKSWSHFLISKEIVNNVGYFDEDFVGVGNEDQDYEIRLVLNGIKVNNYTIRSLRNIVYQTKNFSYGENIEIQEKKYTRVNKLVFDKKWEFSETPKAGFTFVRIMKGYIKKK